MGSRLGHDKVKRMNIYLWSASPISCKRKLKLPIFKKKIYTNYFKFPGWGGWSPPCHVPDQNQAGFQDIPSQSQARQNQTWKGQYQQFEKAILILIFETPLIKSLPVQHMDTTVHKDLPLGRVQSHLNKVTSLVILFIHTDNLLKIDASSEVCFSSATFNPNSP